jgi:hypothetical protein
LKTAIKNLFRPQEEVALLQQKVFPRNSQIKPSTPPPLTPNIENFNPLNVYPDAAGDNSFYVDKVPVFVKLCFKAETDLCLIGIELLSRSFAPTTYSSKYPKRYDKSNVN